MEQPERASLESLAPDRRAVLVLLASQNRSYSDIAQLLATDEAAIRARAFAAVGELLAGVQPEPPQATREQLTDYALGQQRVSERQRTRAMLAGDPDARAWVAELERALGIREPEPPDSQQSPDDPAPPQDEPESLDDRELLDDPERLDDPEAPDNPEPAAPVDVGPEAEPRGAGDDQPPPPSSSLDLSAPAGGVPTALPARLGVTRAYLAIGLLAIVLGVVLLLVGGSGSPHA